PPSTAPSSTPLNDFFTSYSEFSYNPRRSATDEFYRMCDQFGWDSKDPPPDREDAHDEFRIALVQQFNESFGTDVDSLVSWQVLCEALGLKNIPATIRECRNIIDGVHVNLVDFVDGREGGTGRRPRIFDTETELSKYTRKTGKYFPRDEAYAGGLLRYLLRHIFSPSDSRGSNY
ncbi:hypothetical protein K488DRAFT_47884, partial [Vararia minispora EC-137]